MPTGHTSGTKYLTQTEKGQDHEHDESGFLQALRPKVNPDTVELTC